MDRPPSGAAFREPGDSGRRGVAPIGRTYRKTLETGARIERPVAGARHAPSRMGRVASASQDAVSASTSGVKVSRTSAW